MKNLFLIIATVLSFTASSYASNIGDGLVAIIKSERMDLLLETSAHKEFILSSVFNEESESFTMIFETSVSMVQVFNQKGDLEMMFPVVSENVVLGLSLFEKGQYRIGYIVEGYNEIEFTKLIVK